MTRSDSNISSAAGTVKTDSFGNVLALVRSSGGGVSGFVNLNGNYRPWSGDVCPLRSAAAKGCS